MAPMALLIVPVLVHTVAAQKADASPKPAEKTPKTAGEPSKPAKETQQPAKESSSVVVKGYMKLQSGFFVPLISDGFKARKTQAYQYSGAGMSLTNTGQTCDPVEIPLHPCYPIDHGQEAGSLSMGRGTLQLELDWTPTAAVTLHTTSRGVRAVELPADEWAQIPELSEIPAERRELAKDWVLENYYNEFEIFHKLYVDARISDWFSFRIGRQFWSGTGKYQLLDVVNPKNDTWHFGPLESFEETRTPLWMLSTLFEISSIKHSLELFWVPLIVVPLVDYPRDTVTAPLSLVGAWGIPYTSTPSRFMVAEKVFEYPGERFEDMRAGAHWKGNLGSQMRYSLLYYYTHQLSPPIPVSFDQRIIDFDLRMADNAYLERLILQFPRQHIVGLSYEFAFESPIDVITPPFGTPAGLVAKLEATVEPDRTYAVNSDANSITGGRHQDPDPNLFYRYYFEPKEQTVVNYGLTLTRPTMIGFLNPGAPFFLMAQFKHTLVPTYDEAKDSILVEIPGYNNYKVETNLMQVAFAVATIYMKGFLVPKVIGALVFPDSAFYSLDLGINFSAKVGIHLVATDFIGSDPYKRLGLFRDRDEFNMSLTCRF